ncbi:MAG: hypothetical protein OIN88_15830 [Candidatus Methanoperedens sp.]|nr:hypothetical protein [Candidatus Methanoperedens sp.]
MNKTRKSKSKKPSFEPDVIEKELCRLFPKEWLRNAAKETGLIKRERKIEAFVMLWTLVFSFGAQLPRNLANMKRKYEKASKSLSEYSFIDLKLECVIAA